MEKNVDRKTLIISKDEGSGVVAVADDVLAMIAGLAATEVEGVAYLGGNITGEMISKVGSKNLNKGIRVNVSENMVKIDLAVVMEYGYSIPVTCGKIQDKVKTAIENMTGMSCSDVNIRIAGVKLK
ncbi:MAG: Asp23/Gls24 family envelope stress response protein [Lachnospiraceae bacterium]|nr:Asp23/Gls24 family envelope stress response protein [Lachnospiraceae bacterium]